ncbi:T-complex protein 1 subunit delta [Sparassis crispa]|uniref:T-complex protein 1 subunit delta n=1 Tax=Sparassis crispa TaxID=139825 RepID=A0A401G5E1_9APHY|nr:T-complex protein 1 subunit delta [Sparassis crispa]GBE77381.1 T-complex protein 1 subunit delta [Sparassis crispa]
MLVDLSIAQDVEAGDGTTSVVILAGSLLGAAHEMLLKGIHPTLISESFLKASAKAVDYLSEMSTPVRLQDRANLLKATITSQDSKIISTYSEHSRTYRGRCRITLGGTIDDTKIIDNGLVFHQNIFTQYGGPTRVESAKIGLIQFHLSHPKPDMDNTVVITNYLQMDKINKENRRYVLALCTKIRKAGCNVLLIQKSILRDADIERDEIEFLSKTLGCTPVSDIEAFSGDKLGRAELVEEVNELGSNDVVVDEVERSLHDALCVMRCLVKKRALIPGGGAPEVHVSQLLRSYARSLKGVESYCFQAYAEALEVIPLTLAENAGLNAITILTELRNRHALGEKNAGIDMRTGLVSNVINESVVQPLLVSTCAFELATETVCLLMKIDDYVQTR